MSAIRLPDPREELLLQRNVEQAARLVAVEKELAELRAQVHTYFASGRLSLASLEGEHGSYFKGQLKADLVQRAMDDLVRAGMLFFTEENDTATDTSRITVSLMVLEPKKKEATP